MAACDGERSPSSFADLPFFLSAAFALGAWSATGLKALATGFMVAAGCTMGSTLGLVASLRGGGTGFAAAIFGAPSRSRSSL